MTPNPKTVLILYVRAPVGECATSTHANCRVENLDSPGFSDKEPKKFYRENRSQVSLNAYRDL